MYSFNADEWDRKISDPHWYVGVSAVMKEMAKLHDADRPAYEVQKERIYDFFEDRLRSGKIALGSSGTNFDSQRKPIDTIVIHHTSMRPGLTAERLSGIELIRLYAPQYAGKGPSYDANRQIVQQPIYSGHFRNGVQVFWPYHWIVRMDGTCERLLDDNEIGWQAGDWEVNCRSVGLVFDNDYDEVEPSPSELQAMAKCIRENYPHVSKERIIGHCEVNKKTVCPSPSFLPKDAKEGWKDRLIALM